MTPRSQVQLELEKTFSALQVNMHDMRLDLIFESMTMLQRIRDHIEEVEQERDAIQKRYDELVDIIRSRV